MVSQENLTVLQTDSSFYRPLQTLQTRGVCKICNIDYETEASVTIIYKFLNYVTEQTVK